MSKPAMRWMCYECGKRAAKQYACIPLLTVRATRSDVIYGMRDVVRNPTSARTEEEKGRRVPTEVASLAWRFETWHPEAVRIECEDSKEEVVAVTTWLDCPLSECMSPTP